MNTKKNTGSYYTPEYLAGFISKKVLSFFGDKTSISILEPSVGDGAFISQFSKNDSLKIKLTALDINNKEIKKAFNKWSGKDAVFQTIDFCLNYLERNKLQLEVGIFYCYFEK